MSSHPRTTSPRIPFLFGTRIDWIPAPKLIKHTDALLLLVSVYLISLTILQIYYLILQQINQLIMS